MTELERLLKAKIPGERTGIEIKHSLCAICSPGHHCGLDCYVKDGVILKVEGTPDHPYNRGKICSKGVNNRQYVYRADRIRTPLRRVGERGEGKFEPVSWEEAYKIIGENLNAVKAQYGPQAVAFFSGYYSSHLSIAGVRALKERGGKVIIVDPRITPAVKNLADIHLQINPGTDGALALGMAKIIIENGWADMDFIKKYTHGYEQYAQYVKQFGLEKVASICGLDPAGIMEATRIFATNGPAAINQSASTMVHFINGFQAFRAILCLSALTGNFDQQAATFQIRRPICISRPALRRASTNFTPAKNQRGSGGSPRASSRCGI